MFSLYLFEFSPGSSVSSHRHKNTFSLIGGSKLPLGFSVGPVMDWNHDK